MKINLKRFSICLLFCLIFIVLSNINIYAATVTGYIEGNKEVNSESDLGSIYSNYIWDNSKATYKTDTVAGNFAQLISIGLKQGYAEAVKKWAESDFADPNILAEVKITGQDYYLVEDEDGVVVGYDYNNYSESFSILHIDKSFLNMCAMDGVFTVSFTVGENSYTIKIPTYYVLVPTVGDTEDEYEIITRTEYAKRLKGNDDKLYSNCIVKQQMAENGDYILTAISDAAKAGVVAGSIGYGYNVGTMYSTVQMPLSDAMFEIEGKRGYYDFKSDSRFHQSFSYYIHPIFGEMKLDETTKNLIGKSAPISDWMDWINNNNISLKHPSSNTAVNFDTGYSNFISDLSEDTINSKGMKITKSVLMGDGVKKISDMGSSQNPKSVLSYSVPMAFPYIFVRSGDTYTLNTQNLRVEQDYFYCLYDDNIYDKTYNVVASRGSVSIERSQIFLYNQIQMTDGTTAVREGVVIIGEYDECVVDYTESTPVLYATGRKIGFNNAYSDALRIDNANVNLMYVTGEGGKEGYLPKNVLFLPSEEEQEIAVHNYTIVPEAIIQGQAQLRQLDFSTLTPQAVLDNVGKKENHLSFENNPDFIKFYIMFTKISNNTKMEEMGLGDGSAENTEKADNLNLSHWGFYMIRNNVYIQDASLISWLGTDKARSITYVDAETLLEKITGKFNIDPLTYEDWLKMQDIKEEIEGRKNSVLVRVFNITSIVMGVFLMVFAVLICLAYWIDIFNTFSDLSILHYISFGRLYSVEDKELIPYTSVSGGENIKYVTFKDVLIIAAIMVAIGFLFLNVSKLVYIIVYIYNYIMQVLGG